MCYEKTYWFRFILGVCKTTSIPVSFSSENIFCRRPTESLQENINKTSQTFDIFTRGPKLLIDPKFCSISGSDSCDIAIHFSKALKTCIICKFCIKKFSLLNPYFPKLFLDLLLEFLVLCNISKLKIPTTLPLSYFFSSPLTCVQHFI